MNATTDWRAFVRKNRVAILAGVVIVAILIAYLLFFTSQIVPGLQARNQLGSRIAEAKRTLADSQAAQADTPDRLKKQVADEQTKLTESFKVFLTDFQIAGILNALYRYAADSGVSITDLQTQAGAQADRQSAVRITSLKLQVQGASPRLVNFLARLKEASAKSFVITGVNITQSADQATSLLSMDIALYTSPFATGEGLLNIVGDVPRPIPTPGGGPPTPPVQPTPTPTAVPAIDQLAQRLNAPWTAENWPEVISLIEQIRAIDPNYDDMTVKLYAAHVNYAYKLAAAGSIDQAKSEFYRALSIKPDGGEALAGVSQLTGTTPAPPSQGNVYVVRAGDTLFSIGRRFGVTAQAIRAANGLADNNIHPGQQLIIPDP